MPLTANRELNRYVDQELRAMPVAASEHIWKGALVGINRSTGYVRNLAAGDVFAGVAYEEVDNSAGAAGALMIRLYTQGDFLLPITNAAQTLVGGAVYAVANDNVTGLPTAGASLCGILLALADASTGVVRIQPMTAPQIEQTVSVPLVSLTTGITSNALVITQRKIKITSLAVSFNTPPDAGTLSVGIHNTNPFEVINSFNLATLAAHTPTELTPLSRDFNAGVRLWAKVGQATSTAGVGGVLTVRYIELP